VSKFNITLAYHPVVLLNKSIFYEIGY
jgi:hypothetical protein